MAKEKRDRGRAGYFYFSALPSPSAHSIQVLSMCDALERIGFDTTLFATRNPLRPSVDDGAMLDEYGVKNRPRLHWVRWRKGPRGWKIRAFLATARQAGRFDLCLTRLPVCALACESRGRTCIFELHSPSFSKTGRLVLLALKYGRRVRFVANSEVTAEMVSDTFGLERSRIRVAHNGCTMRQTEAAGPVAFDPALFAQFEGPGPYAVYVGSFYEGRGIDTIMELARRHRDVQFVAIGGDAGQPTGPHAAEASPNLRFFGRIPHSLTPRVLERADILLMPYAKRVTSGGEGDYLQFCSPLKMFEYLAAGRAIISTGSPSIQEILRDGENAIVVEAEDVEGWSSAVERLKHDPELRAYLGRNALLTAARNTWEARARAIADFAEAANGRR